MTDASLLDSNNVSSFITDRLNDCMSFNFPELQKLASENLILGPAGEVFDFILTRKETHKKFLVASLSVPPNVGPPPHIHFYLDEWFYAPDGGFSIYAGERIYKDIGQVPGETVNKETLHVVDMKPEQLFYIPRGRMHGFMNTSNETKTIKLVWTPDDEEHGILDYFQSAGITVNDTMEKNTPSFLSLIRLVTHAKRRGINQSTNFWQYVSDVVEEFPEFLRDNHAEELMALLFPYIAVSDEYRMD
ncbi:hypothetical protein GC090_22270 (plasmid) [Pantoea sp. JZ29]|uniref:hypothetical protein n=1 Tax=Pantoea sp. JZ29 TaxID=2654192 RepID=UPI002B490EFC|nr:hypothetical protein [Pantoea sp. JZ29]WRH23371.1 hypothetical protein GC090_22270 [Pantoea sp. JZ29]